MPPRGLELRREVADSLGVAPAVLLDLDAPARLHGPPDDGQAQEGGEDRHDEAERVHGPIVRAGGRRNKVK